MARRADMWLSNPQGNPYRYPSIYENGSRAQDRQRIWSNQIARDKYLFLLMDIAMSVFEWTDLPEGIDARMLEYWLMVDGFCIFFKDDDLKYATQANNQAPEGYAVLQAMYNGPLDMYCYPTVRTAFSVSGINVQLTRENSVLVFDSYLRTNKLPFLMEYANRLATLDRIIDINARAQRYPKILHGDERSKLTMKNLAMQIDDGEEWILLDKHFNMNSVEVLDLEAPYVANQIYDLRNSIWAEAMMYVGVESKAIDKSERVTATESSASMGPMEAARNTRLVPRQQAADEINRLFGLNVSVDFRRGVYIGGGLQADIMEEQIEQEGVGASEQIYRGTKVRGRADGKR